MNLPATEPSLRPDTQVLSWPQLSRFVPLSIISVELVFILGVIIRSPHLQLFLWSLGNIYVSFKKHLHGLATCLSSPLGLIPRRTSSTPDIAAPYALALVTVCGRTHQSSVWESAQFLLLVKGNWGVHLCWLISVSTWRSWEEGTSTEKFPSVWPVGAFSWLVIGVGGPGTLHKVASLGRVTRAV